MGTPSPRSSSAAPLGETIIFSEPKAVVDPVRQPAGALQFIYPAPKAVVENSAAAGAKTHPRTAATRSIKALREATGIPLGSTPATGDAVLGSQNALQSHDFNQTPNEPASFADTSSALGRCPDASVNTTETASWRARFSRRVWNELPPTASIPLPSWQQTAATDFFAAYTINNDNKKTPTSDNVSTPAAQLHPKPPCERMCPLEQSAGGTSKTEWKTEVVDDSAVSTPREKTRTTHSGNWETTAGMRFFCQWVHDCPPRKDALCDHLVRHLHGNHDDCAVDDFYDDAF